jgi:hypothetical protein
MLEMSAVARRDSGLSGNRYGSDIGVRRLDRFAHASQLRLKNAVYLSGGDIEIQHPTAILLQDLGFELLKLPPLARRRQFLGSVAQF